MSRHLIAALMTGLTEIRIDGRGGQGNVMAAYLLAEARNPIKGKAANVRD
jgi:Pyruvate/2-oxoacid:ferredoxin oxidoreductase gamma subunit